MEATNAAVCDQSSVFSNWDPGMGLYWAFASPPGWDAASPPLSAASRMLPPSVSCLSGSAPPRRLNRCMQGDGDGDGDEADSKVDDGWVN